MKRQPLLRLPFLQSFGRMGIETNSANWNEEKFAGKSSGGAFDSGEEIPVRVTKVKQPLFRLFFYILFRKIRCEVPLNRFFGKFWQFLSKYVELIFKLY